MPFNLIINCYFRKMAPLKTLNKQQLPSNNVNIGGVKTRSHLTSMKKEVLPKRKADDSPLKRATVKRSALVDIKNVSIQKII